MKNISRSAVVVATLALISCNPTNDPASTTGSGSLMSSSSSSSMEALSSVGSSTFSGNSSSSAPQLTPEEYESAVEAMELSYENAAFVRNLSLDLWEEFDIEAQEALIDVIEVYADDVDLLGYYVEVSEHEPLTEEELDLVFNLMIDIEDAMEILAAAIETLL